MSKEQSLQPKPEKNPRLSLLRKSDILRLHPDIFALADMPPISRKDLKGLDADQRDYAALRDQENIQIEHFAYGLPVNPQDLRFHPAEEPDSTLISVFDLQYRLLRQSMLRPRPDMSDENGPAVEILTRSNFYYFSAGESPARQNYILELEEYKPGKILSEHLYLAEQVQDPGVFVSERRRDKALLSRPASDFGEKELFIRTEKKQGSINVREWQISLEPDEKPLKSRAVSGEITHWPEGLAHYRILQDNEDKAIQLALTLLHEKTNKTTLLRDVYFLQDKHISAYHEHDYLPSINLEDYIPESITDMHVDRDGIMKWGIGFKFVVDKHNKLMKRSTFNESSLLAAQLFIPGYPPLALDQIYPSLDPHKPTSIARLLEEQDLSNVEFPREITQFYIARMTNDDQDVFFICLDKDYNLVYMDTTFEATISGREDVIPLN